MNHRQFHKTPPKITHKTSSQDGSSYSEKSKTYAVDLVEREEEVRRVGQRVRQHHLELVAKGRIRVVVRNGRALVRREERGRTAAKDLRGGHKKKMR